MISILFLFIKFSIMAMPSFIIKTSNTDSLYVSIQNCLRLRDKKKKNCKRAKNRMMGKRRKAGKNDPEPMEGEEGFQRDG